MWDLEAHQNAFRRRGRSREGNHVRQGAGARQGCSGSGRGRVLRVGCRLSMSATQELAGRCAVVTGASRGIGLAVARALASEGAFVVMTGLDAARGEAAARSVAEAGGQARFVQADWRRRPLAARHGGGGGGAGPFRHSRSQRRGFAARDGRRDLAGGVPRGRTGDPKGAFLGLQHGVAAIRGHGQGGSVVLMASVIGKVGTPMRAAYCASKGGVRLMAKAAALELGPEKIRVNSVHPGLIRTDLLEDVEEAAAAAAIPLGRFGEPEEVARAVLYLASERSCFMTGAELVIDGGWIAQ